MIDHTRYDFGLLRDRLHFCEQVQDTAEVEFSDLPVCPGVDEIQHAARLVGTALRSHRRCIVAN